MKTRAINNVDTNKQTQSYVINFQVSTSRIGFLQPFSSIFFFQPYQWAHCSFRLSERYFLSFYIAQFFFPILLVAKQYLHTFFLHVSCVHLFLYLHTFTIWRVKFQIFNLRVKWISFSLTFWFSLCFTFIMARCSLKFQLNSAAQFSCLKLWTCVIMLKAGRDTLKPGESRLLKLCIISNLSKREIQSVS